MDETRLIQKLREGDQQSFRYLLGQYDNQVVNTCYGFIRQEDEARDVAQEVFIEVFQSIHRFRGKSSLKTWIHRIAVNKSLDYLRKINRKKRLNLWLQKSESHQGALDQIVASQTTPLTTLLEKEQARLMEVILDKLPVNQRVAWTLHRLEEMPQQEVAQILDTTVSAIESLIHRAKKNLTKQMEKYIS